MSKNPFFARFNHNCDYLTGLESRPYFNELLPTRLAETSERCPATLILLDIAAFGEYNAQWGIDQGDRVLEQVARLLEGAIGESAYLCRWDGDSFAILSLYQEQAHANAWLNDLLDDCLEHLGLAFHTACITTPPCPVEHLVQQAEAAIHESKKQYTPYLAQVNGEETALALLATKSSYLYQLARQNCNLASTLAELIGITPKEQSKISVAALWQDIGMLEIGNGILEQPGALTLPQWRIVQQHPLAGSAFLHSLHYDEDIVQLVRYHHENFDGTGYPEGLSGQSIPFGARLLAITSSWLAMNHTRPYRPALSPTAALAVLKEGAGSTWDPELVSLFKSNLSILQNQNSF